MRRVDDIATGGDKVGILHVALRELGTRKVAVAEYRLLQDAAREVGLVYLALLKQRALQVQRMERCVLQLTLLEGGTKGEAVSIAEVDARHLAAFKAHIAPRCAAALAQGEIARDEMAVLELYVAQSQLREVAAVEDGVCIFFLQPLPLGSSKNSQLLIQKGQRLVMPSAPWRCIYRHSTA